jgi:hypothetical protein
VSVGSDQFSSESRRSQSRQAQTLERGAGRSSTDVGHNDQFKNGDPGEVSLILLDLATCVGETEDVLKWAFTVANPVAGIVTRGDPYWHGALGRYGPNPPDQPSNLWKSPVLPDTWDFGHGSYINCEGAIGGQPAESGPFFPPSRVVPPQGTLPPSPTRTPASVRNWRQAWAAGFVSTRFS